MLMIPKKIHVMFLVVIWNVDAFQFQLGSLVDVRGQRSEEPHNLTSESLLVWGTAFDDQHWYLKEMGSREPPNPRTPWKSTDNCAAPTGAGRGAESFSMKGEDMDIYNRYFCNVRGGTYVEIGALDGQRFSNTLFYESTMGWAGALIEATPESAELLRKNRGGNSRNVIFSEGVCPTGQDHMDFIVGDDSAVNGDLDTMSDDFKDTWHPDGTGTVISVPCRTLGLMLQQTLTHTGADHIDFFSLDVEGGELAVLQTMDWSVRVRVWLVELDGRNPDKDAAVEELLAQHGYVKALRILRNVIFLDKGTAGHSETKRRR